MSRWYGLDRYLIPIYLILYRYVVVFVTGCSFILWSDLNAFFGKPQQKTQKG